MSEARQSRIDCEGPPIEIRLVGLNYRTASTAVREALAYTEDEAGHWIRLATEREAVDLGGPTIREAALLCTCNRTEAYLVLSVPPHMPPDEDLRRRLTRLLCGARLELTGEHEPDLMQEQGSAVARHLFRVAAGLDSMIQGEQQILGQVRRAHELTREFRGSGPILDRLFASASRAGKRARSETSIGRGTVSVAGAAVELGTKVVGALNRRSVAVIGAGETGRLVAQHLAAEHPQDLVILNRTAERAEELARAVQGRAAGLDELAEILRRSDLVVVAASAPEPIVTRAVVRSVLEHRPRPIAFIDISVPRNVEPSVHQLDGAFLYDLDVLQHMVGENLSRRREEVPKVEAILEEEMGHFCRWFRSLAAGPLITELRDRFEEVRQAEVERHASQLGPKEREIVERATRGVLNKLLHGPTVHLRNGGSADVESVELIRRMFQLDPEARPEDSDARGERIEDKGE